QSVPLTEVASNSCRLSAQKCDDRHRNNRDRQGIVPDALPANRAFEFDIMGLQILNDRVHLTVDQGLCKSRASRNSVRTTKKFSPITSNTSTSLLNSFPPGSRLRSRWPWAWGR